MTIGKGVVLMAASKGHNVVFMDVMSGPPLEGGPSTLEAAAAAAGNVRYVHGDVRSKADLERAIDEAVSSFGRVDVFVSFPVGARRRKTGVVQ